MTREEFDKKVVDKLKSCKSFAEYEEILSESLNMLNNEEME